MSIENPIELGGVYYLESQNPNMNPIAIRVEITPPNYVSWEDTSHGRVVRFSKLLVDGREIQEKPEKAPERIEAVDMDGNKYILVKLTTQIFNEKLKKFVAGGESLNFNNDQELQDYYLKADFYSPG